MSDIEGKMAEWRKTLWGTGPCPDLSQENFRLTNAEREAVAWAVLDSRGMVCVAYVCREAAEAYCEGTFNRLAPLYRQPQDGVVRLPPLDPNGAPGWNAAIGAVREALANAGVDWDTE